MRRPAWYCACALVLAAALGAAPAPSGETPEGPPRPRLVAPLLAEEPILDGDLGEPFWLKAGLTGRFLDARGEPAQPAVLARVAATKDALYGGFVYEGAIEKDVFIIELDPRAAFAPEQAPKPATPPAAPAEAGLPRIVRIRVPVRGGASVEGAAAKPLSAARTLPGGATVEVKVPFQGLVDEALRPRRGDVWAANLRRGEGADAAAWAASPAGEWAFADANLIDNGDAEVWEAGSPRGWQALNVADGQERRAMTVPEREFVVGGSMACRALYRGRLILRPARRVALRKGATYRMSLLLLAQPDPGSELTATLSAAPSKTADFRPTGDVTRVDMTFRAEADHAEPALLLTGRSGAVVVDDFRLEMLLP